ncbi:MAG TPA: hypothetical protein VNZ45_18485 [Bacteroidia bacterium]|jgi:hypothetical protein|nr:hypothetical protein [Bacteroidia bacterium]
MKIVATYIIMCSLAVSCTNYRTADESGSGDGGSGVPSSIVNEKLKPVEYVAWVENEQHGLRKEKTIDDLVYTAQYRPCGYVICEEERKEDLPDSLVKQKMKELDGMQYISLKIGLKSAQGELLKYKLSSTKEYQERVNYFSFGMQKDIQLIQGGDTLQCALFHFERIYDVAPNGTFLLGFPIGKHPDYDRTLILFDHGFGKGIVKFFFDARDIKNLPQVETI